MVQEDTALTARIVITIVEDKRQLVVHLYEPGQEPFKYLSKTFDQILDTGFAEFSKMLGESLIFGSPALLRLFADDIRASKGKTSQGDVPEPSIDELEQALLEMLQIRPQKVAMIVAKATDRFPGFWDGSFPEAKADEALARLAEHDDVLSFGDIKNWRHSEMCRRPLDEAESSQI